MKKHALSLGMGELVEVGMEVLVSRLLPTGDSLFENKANDKESRDWEIGIPLAWSVHPGQVQPQIRSPDSQLCVSCYCLFCS